MHLANGTLRFHSTVVWMTAEGDENPTDYEWNEVLLLCVFCSGKLRGLIASDNGVELERIE